MITHNIVEISYFSRNKDSCNKQKFWTGMHILKVPSFSQKVVVESEIMNISSWVVCHDMIS